MSILCIGEALIDMICTDKGQSLSEGQHFLKKPGGAPTNVAAAIGALGGQVSLAAKVGDDPFGRQLQQVMQDFQVDTTYLYLDPSHFTTFAFVSLMLDGERDFVFNRGADAHLSLAEVAQIPLENISILHFGSATAFLEGALNDAYYTLKNSAKAQGKTISFDPNYRHLLFGNLQDSFIRQSWMFLKEADFSKMSDEEAMLITGQASLESAANVLIEECPGVFTITLGKDGTLLGLQGKTYLIPSFEVKPVDTTGAGDAFVGAVLYQLDLENRKPSELNYKDWEKIILNANKAGARTCEYIGAMEAFKHLNNNIFN